MLRRIIGVLALLLLLGAWTHGNGAPPVVVCTFTTGDCAGVGGGTSLFTPGVCDGVTDSRPTFFSFQTWAVSSAANLAGQKIQLLIPPGVTCMYLDPTPGFWLAGIKNIVISGYGSTISNGGHADLWIWLGTEGEYHDNTHQARTNAVSAGASFVTLVTSAQTSLYTVGQYALMTGFDLQGEGFPSNQFYFEFMLVTALDGACHGTGTVCFSSNLVNSYLTTWPHYFDGGVGEVDGGGPATLYALRPSWDIEVEWQGLTIDEVNILGSATADGRSVTFTDITFTGCGMFPSQNVLYKMVRVTATNCLIEYDKLIDTVVIQSSNMYRFEERNSSSNLLQISNSTIDAVTGTPKRVVASNTTFTTGVTPGATGFGRSDEFSCTTCTIGNIAAGGVDELGPLSGGNWSLPGQSGGPYIATMTGGLITVPNTHGPVTWSVPGTNFTWTATGDSQLMYQIGGVTQDPTNTYVQTTCVGAGTSCGVGGGFPPLNGATNLGIHVHPSPKFTCSPCSGSPLITQYNTAPAQAPLFSYSKTVYDQTAPTSSTAAGPELWGNVATITLTPSAAYSGATSPYTFSFLYQFGYGAIKADGTSTTWAPLIDLRTAGTRTITASGCTGGGSGTCATDTNLTPPTNPLWLTGSTFPNISASVSDWGGTLTVTIQTNQGVVNP